MSADPTIPYGYRQLPPGTPTQKGDGRFTATRYLKVKPEMPTVREGEVIIRKCAVVQPELLAAEEPMCLDE